MDHLLMRPRSVGVLPGATRQEPTAIRKLVLVLDLYGHRHARVVGDAPRRAALARAALVERARGARGRTVVLVIKRWQVLAMFEHQRALMVATMFVWIHIIIVLILYVLGMLVVRVVLLRHLALLPGGIVLHILHVHLLLYVYIVF